MTTSILRKIASIGFLMGIAESFGFIFLGWSNALVTTVLVLIIIGLIFLVMGMAIAIFYVAYWLWNGETP